MTISLSDKNEADFECFNQRGLDIVPDLDGDIEIMKGRMDENEEEKVEAKKSTDHAAYTLGDEENEQEYLWFERVKLIVYGLHVLKGIIYPLFKVTTIALTSKLLKEVLRVSLDPDFFIQVDQVLFHTSRITSIYLMEPLNFYQTFLVTSLLVALLSIIHPLMVGLRESYLNYMEVKRLQRILYDKVVIEPNLVDLQEARDLVYTKIASIENYWCKHKYLMVDDVASIVSSLILFFFLAWDLGLIYCGATIIIVFASKFCWKQLSTPWSELREKKVSEISDRLLDLVTCKETVLSHTMEFNERIALRHAINSDKNERNHLLRAKTISQCITTSTFTMLMPLVSLYIYSVDLTMERVFQLLIVLVVTDECMRSYLSYITHGPHLEENNRAKEAFVSVVGMDEDDVFPSDFQWHSCFRRREIIGNPEEAQNFMRFEFTKQSDTGASMPCTENDRGLNLENVTLGYARKNGIANIVVENLNLLFPVGSHTAIMGETGLGKSTVLKAIAGLIPVLKGTISFHGEHNDATCHQWRKQVAVINQDSVLFNRTLRENLTYGLSNIHDQDILRVLEKVQLKEMVMALPRKLDTMVHDNGNEFSGGEKQRIQIARLLLSTCPVILLDEMTSALDPKTALDIIHHLKNFVQGKTLIMVTHNIQTLHLVENVFQLQKSGLVSKRQASALVLDVTSD